MLLFILIAIVAASSLFLKSGFNPYRETHAVKNNLYSVCSDEVSARFRDFYRSFATVMGAQITISSINTILTAVFVFGGSIAVCAARRRDHISLRPRAHRRQPLE